MKHRQCSVAAHSISLEFIIKPAPMRPLTNTRSLHRVFFAINQKAIRASSTQENCITSIGLKEILL